MLTEILTLKYSLEKIKDSANVHEVANNLHILDIFHRNRNNPKYVKQFDKYSRELYAFIHQESKRQLCSNKYLRKYLE